MQTNKLDFLTFSYHTYFSDKGKEVVSFAINVKDDPDEPENCIVHVGFSICSPNDQFNKKFGRRIAIDRLNSHSKKQFTFDYCKKLSDDPLKRAVYLQFLEWVNKIKELPKDVRHKYLHARTFKNIEAEQISDWFQADWDGDW